MTRFVVSYSPFRHCVFTIPQELRHFFPEDRSLLNCLFSAVRSVVLRSFHKENKKELFTPWRPHKHFNYTFLRFAFCTALLNDN